MKEIWKDIKGWEGKHQISNYGRIKTFNFIHSGKTVIRYGTISPQGYYVITLKNKFKKEQHRVHRLEAITFGLPIPEHLKGIPIEKLQIGHIDDNKKNNHLDNLMWCTCEENDNWGDRNKKISLSNKGKKMPPHTDEWKKEMSERLTGVYNTKISKSVLQRDIYTNEIIKEYPSTREVERQLGFNHRNISACCLGKQKTAYGYKWSFK